MWNLKSRISAYPYVKQNAADSCSWAVTSTPATFLKNEFTASKHVALVLPCVQKCTQFLFDMRRDVDKARQGKDARVVFYRLLEIFF